MEPLAQRPVLLYDGACRLCRFIARVVLSLDRKNELAVLPLQDEIAIQVLAPLPENELLDSWRFVHRDGSLAGYGAGVVYLLRALRLTRPAGRVLSVVPDRALDAAYRAVARRRSLLGRIVPDGPAPRRYP